MSDPGILESIPHRGPMLLIDEVTECSAEGIVCRKRFREDEFFVQGHYPDFPLVPGVILCECAAQASALLIANRPARPENGVDQVPVLTRLNNVRFKNMVRPGDEIEITVQLRETVGGAWFLDGRIRNSGKLAASLELVCAAAPKPAGGHNGDRE